jgi:hypothetical protein
MFMKNKTTGRNYAAVKLKTAANIAPAVISIANNV